MKLKSIFVLVLLLAAAFSFAGGKDKKNLPAAKTTMADPAEGDYDIKYLNFDLHLTDTSTYVSGTVITTFEVIAPSMTSYVFELDSLMHIDAASINGSSVAVTSSGFIRTITLPTTATAGTTVVASVTYHGTPPSGSGFFNGVTHAVSAGGTHMVYTVSDPWVAKDWWPCKQSVNDKIDSVDMVVTVPRGVVDGSNGLLVSVDTTTTPGYWKYHWKTHYTINYYLVSIAVARYAEYKSYMHFTGSTDSMLVQNFLADTATFNPVYKINFDSIPQIVDYFSTIFGRYPFWKEKYGVCYTTLSGGMENQTMTTIGVPDTRTIAHELCHQWFGDNVTYSRWGEVWLSEGFATYAEALFTEHFWGAAAALAVRQGNLGRAMSPICGQVFVTDTSGAATIFNRNTVYDKAAMVVSMLRYIAPADSNFFRVLRTYQQTYGLGNAATTDLKAIAEAEYGMNLDTFFNQWIYGKGFPKYKVTWDQVGTTAIIKLIQSTSCPATTPHFSTHLELQLHGAGADTFIKVYNSLDTQIYTFDWTPTVTNVYLNPDAVTLCTRVGFISQDTMLRYTLAMPEILPDNISIFPNPSRNFWQVSNLPDDTALTLSDVTGRVLWQGRSSKGAAQVPGNSLPAGNYYLKVSGSKSANIKLVHW